jgi:hypothetical protein
MQYVPLSSTEHANFKRKRGTFFYLKEQPMVPVSVVEASRAALDLPLAFTRKPDNSLALVAILSLEKDNNVHVGPKGLWMGGYMPVVVRAHPFALAYQKDQAAVVVDPDSDWLSTTEGQPLFDAAGNPAKLLNNIKELLKKTFPNPATDTPVLAAIDAAGILEPWTAVSDNLLKINPEKLAALPGEEFLALRQNSALAVVFSHLLSFPRINRVKNLARRKEKMSERQQQDPGFIQDDDIISFD